MNLRKALRCLAIGALVAVTGASAATVAMAGDTSSTRSRPAAAADVQAGCGVNAHRVESCLNDPEDPAKRSVLIDRLIELVDRTGKDDHIRIAMYVWRNDDPKLTTFTNKLIEAKNRGAKVRILLDVRSKKNNRPTFDRLKSTFGKRLQVCNSDASTTAKRCLTRGGIQHNKLFLFDIDGQRTTVVSSINLTPAISTRYNNMVVLRDDAKLYDFYLRYFKRMREGSWSGWDTPGERVAKGSGGRTRGNVYPQVGSHDTVANILRAITDCRAGARKVSLLVNKFDKDRITKGTRLRKALEGLDNQCDVRVLSSNPDDGVRRILNGIDGVRARHYKATPNHHSKYVLVDAQIRDLIGDGPRAERKYVWTGSLNMTQGPWTSANSNVLVRGPETYAVYRSQFERLWQSTNP